MGRPERRVRERKRAAASCRTLDSFLSPAKRNRSTSDSAHSIPAASIELEATASQDMSVVAPNLSTSVMAYIAHGGIGLEIVLVWGGEGCGGALGPDKLC